jgi:hypothetical protein
LAPATWLESLELERLPSSTASSSSTSPQESVINWPEDWPLFIGSGRNMEPPSRDIEGWLGEEEQTRAVEDSGLGMEGQQGRADRLRLYRSSSSRV